MFAFSCLPDLILTFFRMTRQRFNLNTISRFVVSFLMLFMVLAACNPPGNTPRVVVYVTVDQVYSEPVLKAFEKQTGIQVLAVYDIEATKTTGLVNRLVAESSRPQADVFWGNEFAQTLLLKEKGILTPYTPKGSENLPRSLVDSGGTWTGFGGRARILLVNSGLIEPSRAPGSLLQLASGTTPTARVGISQPMFGTAATHAAALYASIGRDAAREYYRRLFDSGVRVLDGNSVVRDLVASGELTIGMTDTDDACVAIQEGKPVQMVFLDQEPGGLGTLLIPNTVAMIKGAPHPQQAQQLLDYLVSPETEDMLVQSGSIQVSTRPTKIQNPCSIPDDLLLMDVDYEMIYQSLLQAQEDLRKIFIR